MRGVGKTERVLAATFALAVVAYLPTLGYGYTGWDDTAYVPDNPHLASGAGLREIWTSSQSDVYYPLMYTSFWLEHRGWGDAPAGYHATNVLLHALNAVLVVLLLGALGAPRFGAALGGALFALHPIQVMTVAWIAERKNLLALLFTLLTLLAWTGGRRGLALLAFVAAVLSKTAVLGLPAALLLYDLLERRWSRRSLLWAAPMLAAAIVAARLTVFFEHAFVGSGDSVLLPGFAERLQIAGIAPWFYLAKLLLPIGLSPAYPRWPVDGTRMLWWIPLLLTLAVVVAGMLRLPKLRTARARRMAWLLAVAVVLLLPSLGVIPFANLALTFVSDHFLYLPSAALLGAAAWVGSVVPWRFTRPAAVLLCAGCVAATLRYQPTFRDGLSLWSRVVEVSPESYAGHLGQAEALAHADRVQEAEAGYARALDIEPRAIDGYLLYGRFLQERGESARAAAAFEQALVLDPGRVPALVGLAACSAGLGAPERALDLYARAVRLAPRDLPAWMGLGATYLGFARPTEALSAFRAAIDVAPTHARAYLGAATCLRALSRYADAVVLLRSGLQRAGPDVALLNLLALTLATAPDPRVRDGGAAVALAKRACAEGPDNYALRATLAAAYAEAGRFDDALRLSHDTEVKAAAAGDARTAAEEHRRAALYARREPLRLG